jgi:retinol dehydrogenase 14
VTQDMTGRYCMVTGANSGIGREISLGLAAAGARLVMVCRDAARGKAAVDDIISRTGNGNVELLIADLSSQHQTRTLAHEYNLKFGKLHVLVNNAGIVMDSRVLTEDRIEMTFAVNYLAYFLLTNLVLDTLRASAPSRVVNVVSQAHKTAHLDFDNLQGEKKYNRDTAYAQSKLADILFTYELARRLEGTDVTVNCVCPGGVYSSLWEDSSKIVNGFFKLLMKGPDEGAKLPLHLACSPEMEGVSCKYFQTGQHLKFQHVNLKGTMKRSSGESYSDVVAGKLWKVSESLTNMSGATGK